MEKKLVLIDGHSILNRAFYGVPDLTDSEGHHTNAVYGFLNIMFKIFDTEQPTDVVVAFDVNKPTFRHEAFDMYKGTRKPMPEELREQVPLMKKVLKTMNIKVTELPGYEADDVLGTLAKRGEKENMKVSVITGDRDLLQLATDNILIRIPKTKKGGTEIEDYYAKDVKEKYLVTPEEFIDVKALMGDTSDNIPGVPSVGEKTATKLIAQYHSIENLYEHLDEVTRPKLHEALKENKQSAIDSKWLATINIDSPVEIDFNETVLGDMFNSDAYDLMKKLGFKSLLKRFDGDVEKISEYKPITNTISDLAEAGKVIDRALNENVGIYLVSENEEILGLVVAFSKEEIYIIQKEWFITEDFLKDGLNKILFSKNNKVFITKLKQHLKFVECTEDIQKGTIFDAEIAAYLIDPLKSEYNYEDLSEYAEVQVPFRSELIGKKKLVEVKEENVDNYNTFIALTALIPMLASENLIKKLEEYNEMHLFEDVEMPLIYSLNRMEKYGVKVEKQELADYSKVLGDKIDILTDRIYKGAGKEFNINSPKQLGMILFEDMGIPGGKKTKTGYSTSAEVLEKLSIDYPFVKDVLEYRQLSKLKSTYADGLVNYIGDDGRIHGTFNQTVTATGRISSTEPNLQNIPIRMEMGKLFRKVFVPEDGYVFIDADYSQIELRILASISEDENLIEAYKSHEDIHRITASKVFDTPFEEVTDLQRRNAKAVNFGIVYGISSFGLSNDIGISRKQAKEYIDQYFATYPGIKKFLDDTVSHAKENGYVVTLMGRRRPIPNLKSSNFMERQFGERVAMNSPIQGTAADIMKVAMINVDAELRKRNLASRIVLQVHDELLIETKIGEEQEVKEIIMDKMKHAMDLKVPMEIGFGIGENWLDAH